MPRAKTTIQRFSFNGGLNTEANPLTFPEGSSKDEANFVLLRNGGRQRRLGMDYEQGFSLIDSGVVASNADTNAVTLHRWQNINDDAAINLVIVQIGCSLFFYDLNADIISAAPKNGGNPVVFNASVLAPDVAIQTASISGALVIVTGSRQITLMEYDEVTDTIATRPFNIQIRDLFGVDDNLPTDGRPSALSDEHKYNLLNQGWTVELITEFKSKNGNYPSNADIVQLGKDTDDKFNAELLASQFFGNSPSAKGKCVIDAFQRGQGRSLCTSIPVDDAAADGNFGFLNPRPPSGSFTLGDPRIILIP